jgi:hypothetical protein
MNTEWVAEVPVNVMLDSIFPYLISYHLVGKGYTPTDLTNEHLSQLGGRWKISQKDAKNKSTSTSDVFDTTLLHALYAHTEVLEARRGGRRAAGTSFSATTMNHLTATDNTFEGTNYPAYNPKTHHLKELERNYFGLPPYALHRTAEGIVYQARKPFEGIMGGRFGDLGPTEKEEEEEEEKSHVEKTEVKVQNHKYVQTKQSNP